MSPAIQQPSSPLPLPVQTIKQQLADGVTIRRVGFVSSGAPARQGSPVRSNSGIRARLVARALHSVLRCPCPPGLQHRPSISTKTCWYRWLFCARV